MHGSPEMVWPSRTPERGGCILPPVQWDVAGGTCLDKDWHELVATAEAQGWRIKELRRHSVMLLAPDGLGKVTLASTPSDHRALANTIARMRRLGFVWPPEGGRR